MAWRSSSGDYSISSAPYRAPSRTVRKLFCTNCGAKLATVHNFCPKCGVAASKLVDLTNHCACGTLFGDNDKHCHSCGKKRPAN